MRDESLTSNASELAKCRSEIPGWTAEYLDSVRRMLQEAESSPDPRVKLLALALLERQSSTIRDLMEPPKESRSHSAP